MSVAGLLFGEVLDRFLSRLRRFGSLSAFMSSACTSPGAALVVGFAGAADWDPPGGGGGGGGGGPIPGGGGGGGGIPPMIGGGGGGGGGGMPPEDENACGGGGGGGIPPIGGGGGGGGIAEEFDASRGGGGGGGGGGGIAEEFDAGGGGGGGGGNASIPGLIGLLDTAAVDVAADIHPGTVTAACCDRAPKTLARLLSGSNTLALGPGPGPILLSRCAAVEPLKCDDIPWVEDSIFPVGLLLASSASSVSSGTASFPTPSGAIPIRIFNADALVSLFARLLVSLLLDAEVPADDGSLPEATRSGVAPPICQLLSSTEYDRWFGGGGGSGCVEETGLNEVSKAVLLRSLMLHRCGGVPAVLL